MPATGSANRSDCAGNGNAPSRRVAAQNAKGNVSCKDSGAHDSAPSARDNAPSARDDGPSSKSSAQNSAGNAQSAKGNDAPNSKNSAHSASDKELLPGASHPPRQNSEPPPQPGPHRQLVPHVAAVPRRRERTVRMARAERAATTSERAAAHLPGATAAHRKRRPRPRRPLQKHKRNPRLPATPRRRHTTPLRHSANPKCQARSSASFSRCQGRLPDARNSSIDAGNVNSNGDGSVADSWQRGAGQPGNQVTMPRATTCETERPRPTQRERQPALLRG